MIALVYILSGLSLLISVLILIHQRSPGGWILLFPKLFAGALSPYWAVMGAAGGFFGGLIGAYWAVPMGIIGTGMMILYVWQNTRDHKGFDKAFGVGWGEQISPQQAKQMVKRRWSWFLRMKTSPEPVWERDVPFWTIPDTDRELLCDIWRPGDGDASGLAFIYIHGGAWAIWDKDTYTRPFFRHLVAQGHTVMDISYRLIPEVDIYGMIGDVKHAIAWMKANADRFCADPDKVVLGGGSAGGHLALLAGYTPGHPGLTPEDLIETDLSVCGVVSYYGPADLQVVYDYMNLRRLGNPLPVPIGQELGDKERFQLSGRLDILLGDWPQDAPEMYALASPITHVNPGCPPTLLIQGNHDVVCSVDATDALYMKLVESGVAAINLVFPRTAHGFDVALPQINPAAQSALYDVDRFLALMLNR